MSYKIHTSITTIDKMPLIGFSLMRKVLIVIMTLFTYSSIAADCSDKNYQDFDFWLGEWQVTSKADDVIRFNSISKINNGCTILEEYSSPSGYVGKSLNIYDQHTKKWYQTWTDSSGLLLQLRGGIKQGTMVMVGETLNDSQQTTINQIHWIPNEDGTVRQHWQVSQDNGKTWQTTFDGLYKRVTNN